MCFMLRSCAYSLLNSSVFAQKQNIWGKCRNYSSRKSCRKLIYIFSFKPTQMIEALIERGRFAPLSLSILKHYRYKFHPAPKSTEFP